MLESTQNWYCAGSNNVGNEIGSKWLESEGASAQLDATCASPEDTTCENVKHSENLKFGVREWNVASRGAEDIDKTLQIRLHERAMAHYFLKFLVKPRGNFILWQ